MRKNNIKPLVSIIMNCRNGERFLRESISSAIAQSYKKWELIFWDNCSTDNSKKILKKFKDNRIKYFKSKKFVSLYAARNLAIKKAKGDYISFLDTDDLWLKNKLSRQINYLLKKKQNNIVYSNFYILNNNTKKKLKRFEQFLPEGRITQQLLNKYTIGILSAIVKKNVFKNLLFNKKYNVIGDFDFFIKTSMISNIGSINEPLAIYRIHDSNFSLKNMKMHIEELSNWTKFNHSKLKKKIFH